MNLSLTDGAILTIKLTSHEPDFVICGPPRKAALPLAAPEIVLLMLPILDWVSFF